MKGKKSIETRENKIKLILTVISIKVSASTLMVLWFPHVQIIAQTKTLNYVQI